MITALQLLAGLGLLVLAGDYLVRGAVALAEKLGIRPVIIGLTVVAFGTSAPELFVSVQAAIGKAGGIAIGNVVGSNIANILLVLGAPALIAAVNCFEKGVGRNIIVMVAVTAALMAMMLDGTLDRTDAVILLLALAGFLFLQIKNAYDHQNAAVDYHDEVSNLPASKGRIAAFIAAGLAGLPLGAHLTVESAVRIAEFFDVSDAVIGLTVVAVGTSLPELATSVAAAWRGSSAVMIGNVVGSNIFNIAFILGVASLIRPIVVPDRVVTVDMWVMAAVTVLLGALYLGTVHLKKAGGVLMLAAFSTYIILIF